MIENVDQIVVWSCCILFTDHRLHLQYEPKSKKLRTVDKQTDPTMIMKI